MVKSPPILAENNDRNLKTKFGFSSVNTPMAETRERARISLLNIPIKAHVDVSSPISCFKSMGLLKDVGPESDIQRSLEYVDHNDANATAAVWNAVGGVKMGCLNDTIIIHENCDVEGPCSPEDIQQAPLVFCKIRDLKTGADVIAMIASNSISKVSDVCVYDPLRKSKEETLYSIAGCVGSWLRVLLGAGWGLRIEVYCDNYAPSEIPEMKKLWILIMIVLKPYTPHVRMIDTQAALRVECLGMKVSLGEIVSKIVLNIHKLCESS